MFAGHLAVGLALKKLNRRINLGWLFFAAMFHDFLLGILVLVGLEQVHIPLNFSQIHYLTFTFPYSHGLAATFIWSLLAFLITYAALSSWSSKERKAAGLVMGLAVFSHFVLDWIVHIPEMPLLGENSLKIGLGLWNNLSLALALEFGLVIVGLVIYYRSVKPSSRLSRYGVLILLLLISTFTILGQAFSEVPPPETGAAISWIAQPILISALAFWFDKKA